MRLNDTIIRNTKAGLKLRKLSDGDGLYLFVQPNGARWWRMRYFIDGVEKMLSVGVYPEVSLKEARQRREDIRRTVAAKVDPSEGRKSEKRARGARSRASHANGGKSGGGFGARYTPAPS